MTWFKVDDGLHSHLKARRAIRESASSMSLWALAGSWCADQLTDGWLPDYVAADLMPKTWQKDARALVNARLWVVENRDGESGWRFHEWNEAGRQPTREQVLAERKAAAQRQQRARGKARESQGSHAVTGGPANTENRDRDHSVTTFSGDRDHSVTDVSGPVDNFDDHGSASVSAGQGEPSRQPSRRDTRVTHGGSNGPPDPTRPVYRGGHSETSTNGATGSSPEPPLRCPEHIDNPNPPPCGACGSARRVRAVWEADRRRRQDDAPKCRAHRGQPADNCALCRSEALAGDAA